MARPADFTPRIDAPDLGQMTDGDASGLVPEGRLAGQSFVGSELDGRRLAGVSFRECTFQDVSVDGADLRSAGFVDVAIERLNAPVFSAPRSQFRRVVVDGSRFGSAEVYESEWESVEFRNCKLGYVNLRGAELQDVLFTGCILDELDLGGAAAHRLAFADSRVRRLDLTAAKLKHVDLRGLELRELAGLEGLRGAAMTPFQISELAPLFAAHFGIVEKT